ncbi:MAG: GNAT family N-acetyltransferase [Dehalococcoidia bacterium]|nr:GNAT family N-acetyltransferase [Dehalococcoidia bacterium]
MHGTSIDFRWATDGDLPELARLYAARNGVNSIDHVRHQQYIRFLEYKYARNPQAPRGVRILVALEGSTIVGMRPVLPFTWMLNGQRYQGEWGTDFVVSGQHRGKGIGTGLIREWHERSGSIAALASAPASRHIYDKLGLRLFEDVPLAVAIIRPTLAFRQAMGLRVKIATVGAAGWKFVAAALAGQAPEFNIEPVGEFPAEMDPALVELSAAYRAIVVRTCATLNWRFGPEALTRHHRGIATDGKRVRGYVVTRAGYDRRGVSGGIIADILSAAGDEQTYRGLVRYALDHFRGNPAVSAVVCRASHPALLSALRAEGFAIIRRGHSFMFHPDRSQVDPEDVAPTDQWHLTLGDSDGHFTFPWEAGSPSALDQRIAQ